jgi:hypothetical protein
MRSLSSRSVDPATLRAQLGALSRDPSPVSAVRHAVIGDVEHRDAALATLHRIFADQPMQNSGAMLWLAAFADYFDDPDLARAARRRAALGRLLPTAFRRRGFRMQLTLCQGRRPVSSPKVS